MKPGDQVICIGCVTGTNYPATFIHYDIITNRCLVEWESGFKDWIAAEDVKLASASRAQMATGAPLPQGYYSAGLAPNLVEDFWSAEGGQDATREAGVNPCPVIAPKCDCGGLKTFKVVSKETCSSWCTSQGKS